MRSPALALTLALLTACASDPTGVLPSDDAGTPATEDASTPPPAPESDADTLADVAVDAPSTHVPDAAPLDAAKETGPSVQCMKHLTVVFAVGTGAGSAQGNGCWTVVDADGAANHSFRKCSTSTFVVKNPSAPNYAYDDTNPTRPLSEDQTFLQQCSQGATGNGYEYMAYRGSWRLLPASHLRADFAELYGDQTDDVDSLWFAGNTYRGNPQLAGHHAYPMINIGPTPGAHLENKIEADTLAICKTVPDQGYFGTYVATWQLPMGPNDPRIIAFNRAMDRCTTS